MENKNNQPEITLETILRENNLYDALYEILNNHELDLECLQQLSENNEDKLCEKLGLDIIKQLKFKKLMRKINPPNSCLRCKNNFIYISDEVHDYIEVPHNIRIIIDTPEFQRLRELKQLGATYYVFPGATHNRFEHSLGVMHLARKLMISLKMNQPALNISNNEIYCVSAAGLLHDLGHGPFSHVFDHEFVPSMTHYSFRHENMSILLIKKLFKDNKIEISEESLDLICALVSPSTHKKIVKKYRLKTRGFLFEIVANEENGCDVDKWDYFLRDSHNLSLDISFKYTRLLTHCRVIDDHICFHDKTNYDVQILFNTRYDLFKRVYSHKTSKAVEYMICDIMRYANPWLKITEKITNALDFMELTDNIIHRIQWTPVTMNNYNKSDRDAMEQLCKAKDLIRRMQIRDLYKCVAYILLESRIVAVHEQKLRKNIEKNNNESMEIECENDSENNDIKNDENECEMEENSEISFSNKKIDYHFVENQWRHKIFKIILENENNNALNETDLICQLMSISYGSEKEHPLKNVRFYNDKTPNKSKTIEMDQVTTLHDPSKFREVIFRVYVKDVKYKVPAQKAFTEFCEKNEFIEVQKNKDEQLAFSLGISPKKATPPRKNKNKNKGNVNNLYVSTPTTPKGNNPTKRKLVHTNLFDTNNSNQTFENSNSTPTTPNSKKQKFNMYQ